MSSAPRIGSPWPVTKTRIDGTAHPKPPGTQSFWVAKSSGSSASLHWKVRDGAYRVVVMNADASPGVHTMSDVSVKIPHLATASLVALIIGLVMAGGGVALMALPTRGRRDGAAPGETGTPAAQYAIG